MAVIGNTGYAWEAWERAVDKGYVDNSIRRHVGEECFNLLVGGMAGVVAAVGGVMVCSAAGASVGAALGGYLSAGNPAAIYATAELGATIGRTIATTALTVLGVASIAIYLTDHMWEIGSLAIAAYDLAVNQIPVFDGPMHQFLLDQAARWFAEAVGLFCGFLVFAIACLVIARVAKSEKGQTVSQSVRDLFDSRLNDVCKGLVQWVVPRAQDLRYKRQPAGKLKFAVINGGVGPEQMSMISRVLQFTRNFMPQVVNPSTRLVAPKDIAQLNHVLTSNGFKLTTVSEWGPQGGKQLFYERGNICCRVKTKGDASGPRTGQAHLSVGVNDGLGTAWYNDMAKVAVDGRLTFKATNAAEKFQPMLTMSDGTRVPQRFIGLYGGLEKGNPAALQDAWAANCHFNMPSGFSWRGLEGITKRVRH